jgi:hypothetical protein
VILNNTYRCYDNQGRPLEYSRIKMVVAHRTDLNQLAPGNPKPIADDLLTGWELCKRFYASPELGTCCRPPYHVLIRMDGIAEQMIPLLTRGAHARLYNGVSLAVAVVGRIDRRPMRSEQWTALVSVCADLCVVNGGLDIVGHTDPRLAGSSGDQNKKCPGQYLNTDTLEKEVVPKMPAGCQGWGEEQVKEYLTGRGWGLV